MKLLPYIAIVTDYILSNLHWAFSLSSAETEWYVSDIGGMARVSLWITFCFLTIRQRWVFRRAAKWTLFVWMLFSYLDVFLTITKTTYGLNPNYLMVLFLGIVFVIHLYHDSTTREA